MPSIHNMSQHVPTFFIMMVEGTLRRKPLHRYQQTPGTTAAFSLDFALQEPLPGPPEALGEPAGIRLPSIPEQPTLEVEKSGTFPGLGMGQAMTTMTGNSIHAPAIM